jgi:hypothetical protein
MKWLVGCAAAALIFGSQAQAATMVWTFTGTVRSGAADPGNFFGPTRDMTGEAWTAYMLMDTSLGVLDHFSYPSAAGEELHNTGTLTPPTPVFAATLTIGGYVWDLSPHQSFTQVYQYYDEGTSIANVSLTSEHGAGTFMFNAGVADANAFTFPATVDGSFDATSFPEGELAAFLGSGSAGSELIFMDINHAIGAPYVAPGDPPPAVPEPSTWAMLLLGVFAAGGALRGRRRATA